MLYSINYFNIFIAQICFKELQFLWRNNVLAITTIEIFFLIVSAPFSSLQQELNYGTTSSSAP